MSLDEKLLLRNKILGVLIRDARLAAGKTQEACASFLGISASRFSDVEYGERPLSLPEVEALAYLLNVPLKHFWGHHLLEANGKSQVPMKELLTLRNRVIGVLLRQARLAAGETQGECAAAIGAPGSRISAYEHGQIAIPLAELDTLAGFLNVSLEHFVDEEYSPLGKKMRQNRALEAFGQLPEAVQEFMLEPLHTDYLRVAQRLRQLPAQHLRNIAQVLLEITY